MPQFSRPVYEGLPWLYIICGVLVLGGSYLLAAHGALSLVAGVLGLMCLLGGVVVLLRRRDYRAMRSQYPDTLTRNDDP
jgi:hypothetical protein